MYEIPMTVVIPSGNYANLQPTVTGMGNTFEEAKDDALRKAQAFYDSVDSPASLSLKTTGLDLSPGAVPMEKLTCWATGTQLHFDSVAHQYFDASGAPYESGSTYAKRYEHEFNKAMILPKYATARGVQEELIAQMWDDKAESSTTFGTALHKAMETYLRHYPTAITCGKEPEEMIHPMLRPLVTDFFARNGTAGFVPEVFIADAATKRCGQIDLLRIIDPVAKVVSIEDYKTNVDLHKQGSPKFLKAPYTTLPNTPIGRYTLQLSFYASILEAAGWTVQGLVLHTPVQSQADSAWFWQSIPLNKVKIV